MNVDELWSLTQWYDTEIINRRIPEQYSQLHTVLRANTQPNSARQPFEAIKDGLIEAITAVNVWRLSHEQLEFLETVNVAQNIGEKGVAKINDILFRNAIDIATAANKLQEISQQFAAANETFLKLRSGLAGIVKETPTKLNPEEALIRVRFTRDASIKDVVDLKDWSESWFTISRGIAMAQGQAPEAVRVVSAGTGSIVIELGMLYGMALTTSRIILEALKVADRVLEIRKKAAEIRAMHLSNEKIEKELTKEAEKERTDGAEAIVSKVMAEVGLKADGDGDKAKSLHSAIKALLEFTTKGGEVDCVLPPDEQPNAAPEAVATRAQLKVTFQEIRTLEYRQRQIGYGGPEPSAKT